MEMERWAWAGGGVSAQLPIPSSLPFRTIIHHCSAPRTPSFLPWIPLIPGLWGLEMGLGRGSHLVLFLGVGVGWVLGHPHTLPPCPEKEAGGWWWFWEAEQDRGKGQKQGGTRGRPSRRHGDRDAEAE